MSTHQDDLDLLLSLQDRVFETPPASPSTLPPPNPGYHSDHGSPTRVGNADMSVFRDAVQDYLEEETETVEKAAPKLNRSKNSNDPEVEKFSGLRIRDRLVSASELSNRFSDIRFVRLAAIRNLLVGDTLSGCWATVGVLTEKGNPKVSSTGKNFCIWKMGCLDEKTISVFLFGDAYQKNWKEQAGTVFALFNCGIRKDAEGKGFSLSVYSAGQILKMGISTDYGVCKGKRKDGMACTLIINKRRGIYCSYHKSKASQKYSIIRTELKGGNLRTAFRDPLKSEGIYLLAKSESMSRRLPHIILLVVANCINVVLNSNAGKVTTNTHSQGIRFLTEVTGKMQPKNPNKGSTIPNEPKNSSQKRLSSAMKLAQTIIKKNQPDVKRKKTEQASAMKTEQASEKMIELEFVSSEEEE
ncbi:hypothetical protein HHK36_010326 [Tetracentron sinense]|uniref:Zinc finger Mcm10/DnaG-type domain-containing protein n=1 Tax=Tetracentron sinense TaxID=13715 RepID=A0A834ZGR4_TETSI|nr:hypothetical protein HHK36_010326 [Tetracentron sinense]